RSSTTWSPKSRTPPTKTGGGAPSHGPAVRRAAIEAQCLDIPDGDGAVGQTVPARRMGESLQLDSNQQRAGPGPERERRGMAGPPGAHLSRAPAPPAPPPPPRGR